MGRLLLLAVAIGVLIWLVRRAASDRGAAKPPPPPAEAGSLVRCARCGVHVPRQDAIQRDDLAYCGPEHARLGPGAGPG